AKHAGQRDMQALPLPPSIPTHVKRSYKRAYARSCREGGAWYRGLWRPYKWFSTTTIRTQAMSRISRTPPTARALKVLTWNSGGLHSQVLRELETWAQDTAQEIVLIQETKWDFEGNWSTPHFHFVHSAGHVREDKVGGLLTMISTKVVKRSEIQFHSVFPGRLLHLRLNLQPPIDIINAYQYAANDNNQTPERRHRFILRLQSTLRSVPARNTVILAGDFNTTCVPLKQVCGNWVMPANEAHHKDHEDFMAVLANHALSVLNTWTRPHHQQLATFTFGKLASQIDYIVCRQSHANNRAKQAAILQREQFPVACWRDGATHHPVQGFIPLQHPQWHKSVTKPPPKIDVNKLVLDMRQQPPPQALVKLRESVASGLENNDWQSMTQLEEGIMALAQELYAVNTTRPQASEASTALAQCARDMWALFREMRSHSFTATGIMQAWKQWKDFSRLHREHKARSKARSKQRRHDLLTKAQTAANKGDMHQVWQVVKTLAPKTKPKPLQLYRQGHIMTPESELNWIAEAFGERYGARKQPQHKPDRQHDPFQVTTADVWHELDRLPLRKAVPPDAAPAAAWKACSAEVSAFIADQVNFHWAQPQLQVQQSWADATVVLIPKPAGKNAGPLDWRPIGLQHPIGKSIMRIVINQARHQINQLVQEWPQCAYVPHRSTFTALKRVYQHCDVVRRKCAQQRTTLHQQKEGIERTGDYGGLQISMDLSAAFDLVPWDAVKEALELARIDPFVQEVLLQWLGQVRYKFRHKGMEKEVWPSWGLRQGCIGSPILWAAFTALLSRAIDHRIQDRWCRDHATLYADDSHLRWQFANFQEFERAVVELRWVIAIFRRMGMKVNTHKTKAIMNVVGPMKHKIHKLYVRAQGQEKRLLLAPGDPSAWIQLVDRRHMLPDIKPEMMQDEEMDEFFGSLKIPEETGDKENRPRQGETAARNTPFGPFSTPNKRRRNPFEDRNQQYTSPPPYQPYQHHHHRNQDRDPLVFTLAKTVLKQQEELRVLRQDTAFILFMRPGQDSILHHLYSTAVAFKTKQEADPTWQLGQQPLRMVLAQALFREVVSRLNNTIATQERLRRVTDQGWRDATGWRYQMWNPRTRQLEVDPSRPPIPEDKLLDHLSTILQCLKHPVLTRFHCTRKMTETMVGQATYKMDLSLRSHPALTLWDEMRLLQGNAVFQLVGLGYKTEGLGRGPVEQRIMDMMYGRR
ncbi:unnamed protein product, partial [Symbiodinium sp. CCMP2456]